MDGGDEAAGSSEREWRGACGMPRVERAPRPTGTAGCLAPVRVQELAELTALPQLTIGPQVVRSAAPHASGQEPPVGVGVLGRLAALSRGRRASGGGLGVARQGMDGRIACEAERAWIGTESGGVPLRGAVERRRRPTKLKRPGIKRGGAGRRRRRGHVRAGRTSRKGVPTIAARPQPPVKRIAN